MMDYLSAAPKATIMRWIVGLFLVIAAVLKTVQLVSEPASATLGPVGTPFLQLQIGIELAIGLFLLSGLLWRQLRWIALVLFAGFASYSLLLALGGAASCGCFGPIHIHPWWTFSLDVCLMLALILSLRQARACSAANDRQGASCPGWRIVAIAIISVSTLTTVALVRYVESQAASANNFSTVGGITILEPERWIGRKLPILDFIDLDMSKGKWNVLLHRHDCPVCQATLPRFVAIAAEVPSSHTALIEVPPYGEPRFSGDATVYCGRLQDSREWFVHTPVELQLIDGVVTAASTELPAVPMLSGR